MREFSWSYNYRLYAMTLSSSVPLPLGGLLPPNQVPTAFTFEISGVPSGPEPSPDTYGLYRQPDGSWCLDLVPVARYWFPDQMGRVVANAYGTVAEEEVAAYFAGVTLPVVLGCWGFTVFHCSAVQTEVGAVLLMGPSGAGKSTLASGLALSGFPLLADDIVPIVERDGRPYVLCGPNTARLTRESRQIIGITGPSEEIAGSAGKGLVSLAETARCESVPLAAAFLLEFASESEAVMPQLLPATQATIALLSNVFGLHLFPGNIQGKRLQVLTNSVIPRVSVHKLSYPHRPGAISEVAACIQAIADLPSRR